MPFTKKDDFTRKIIDLPDKPTIPAEELKAYFDIQPEELRVALNNLIDQLANTTDGSSGADNIGVTPIDSSPDNLQDVLKWLKQQIDFSALGQIPDGSITPEKFSIDAKKASNITVADTANVLSSTNVEDALKELFLFADNGKKDIASVVGSPAVTTNSFTELKTHIQNSKNTLATNLTNKGQASTGSESLSALVAKVVDVNTGKKFASGTAIVSATNIQFKAEANLFLWTYYWSLDTSALTFKPSVIICFTADKSEYGSFITVYKDKYYDKNDGQSWANAYYGSAEPHALQVNLDETIIKIPYPQQNRVVRWFAYE